MYVFDTDILSNIIKKQPSQNLIASLEKTPLEYQFTTVITIGEMVYGAHKSNHQEFFLSKLKNVILPNIQVLPFDEISAHVYGELRAALERQGRVVAEPDLRIASITLQHRLTLVTGNTAHFARIPKLKVENWL